ncbi:hypothetical protein RCZ04_14130 [Capnocytophaga sp. HP1101]
MKHFFASILLLLLLCSCENRVEEKQRLTGGEPPITSLPDKAPVPYVDCLKLNYEDFLNRYKDKYPPKSEVTFIMNDLQDGIISEFRVGLYNCFSEKEAKERDILIKEVTWDISSDDKYLTIWYRREGKHWVPIDHLLYSKDTRF